MKPFNIEEAKAGKPVCTRDGHEARIICFDALLKCNKKCILSLIKMNDYDEEYIYMHNINGTSLANNNSHDLFMKGEHHTGYINIYDDKTTGIGIYSNIEDATSHRRPGRIDTIKIEWDE